MIKLKVMFKENWKAIIFSYSLFSINSILMLVYPKVLGNAIDHLIANDYSYIWNLVATFTSLMFFGYDAIEFPLDPNYTRTLQEFVKFTKKMNYKKEHKY